MQHLDGVKTLRRRKAHAILSVRELFVESLVEGLGVEGQLLDQMRSISKNLIRSRNRWDIGRRSLPQDAEGWLHGNGFAGRGRLTKNTADKLLRQAFGALDGEQRQLNSLAVTRRVGAE